MTPVLIGSGVTAGPEGDEGDDGLAAILRPRPFFPPAPPSRSSRRRRLWEVPHKHHCPIIGVCFQVDELRKLTRKVVPRTNEPGDYDLHTLAVSSCDERNSLSELLSRTLDRRFAVSIKRFARIKTSAELRLAWRSLCEHGGEIPAGLWALSTHPACDEPLEQDIYRDVHMIQHQVGSGARVDLRAMDALKDENARLQHELRRLRESSETLQQEHSCLLSSTRLRLSELNAELLKRDAQLSRLRTQAPSLERPERPQLQQRLQAAEDTIRLMSHKEQARDKEIERLRDFARYAEETIEALSAEDAFAASEQAAVPASVDQHKLLGKCVLCVGGRPGAVHSYRDVVEQSGGRFMHHDGGLEESKHRIDAALSAADIVICQAGCISHNAYWRVKEQCKRSGKLCLFVKNSGLGSFSQVVDAASRKSGTA